MNGGFEEYLSKAKADLEQAISALTVEVEGLTFSGEVAFTLKSGGKRLRPLLLMLAGEAVGGSRE